MTHKIKVVATDTIQVTAVSSEPLQAGTEFTVDSGEDAKRLEGYGHKRGKETPTPSVAPRKRTARK